jgi:hypothetical protein
MENKNFTTTIVVDQSPKEVFDAVNRPQDWWSGEIEGKSTRLNDEFTYRYKDLHWSTQKVITFVPGQKVVWEVIDSTINYAQDKQEWTGTLIVFEISEHDNKTQLRFTHIGLNKDIECYNDCSRTWTNLIRLALFTLITTGKTEKLVLA